MSSICDCIVTKRNYTRQSQVMGHSSQVHQQFFGYLWTKPHITIRSIQYALDVADPCRVALGGAPWTNGCAIPVRLLKALKGANCALLTAASLTFLVLPSYLCDFALAWHHPGLSLPLPSQ